MITHSGIRDGMSLRIAFSHSQSSSPNRTECLPFESNGAQLKKVDCLKFFDFPWDSDPQISFTGADGVN